MYSVYSIIVTFFLFFFFQTRIDRVLYSVEIYGNLGARKENEGFGLYEILNEIKIDMNTGDN